MGAATARRLVADGYRVALVDVAENAVKRLASELGNGALALAADISDAASCDRTVTEIERAAGAIDILVNNAGVLSNHKSADTTPEEWRRVLSVNLDGAFYLSRRVLPGMKSRRFGRIVNVCSLAMKSGGLTAGTAYTASKGALAALTFSLAREAAPFGVTVNAISPAYVKTPMVTEQLTEAQRQALLAQIPVGRFCEPEEFAHCVSFLVAPLSGFITGEILDLNGGLHFD
jgi:3-oxoacyl-[acyl-carrier protein] reductase